jgi:hypothetical protein
VLADIGSTLTGLGTLVLALTAFFTLLLTHRKVGQVITEVKTANGNTLAALADQAEGRRIQRDIPPEERTSHDQRYVEDLPDHPSPPKGF